MTAKIIPFLFKTTTVRTIEIDDLIWFVASDVAAALNYRNSPDLTRILDEDEKGTHIVRTPGGNQEVATINESGLYHAILKSRKPEAVPFRKWVTNEVLPAIRKTGRYEQEQEQPATCGAIQSILLSMDDALMQAIRKQGDNRRWMLVFRDDANAELKPIPNDALVVTNDTLPVMLQQFRQDAALDAISQLLAKMSQRPK